MNYILKIFTFRPFRWLFIWTLLVLFSSGVVQWLVILSECWRSLFSVFWAWMRSIQHWTRREFPQVQFEQVTRSAMKLDLQVHNRSRKMILFSGRTTGDVLHFSFYLRSLSFSLYLTFPSVSLLSLGFFLCVFAVGESKMLMVVFLVWLLLFAFRLGKSHFFWCPESWPDTG